MHLFDVVTILCTSLMVGNELAVSLFVNPAIWRQDDQAMASVLAGSLGKVMPFWYAVSLIFIGVEAYLRHGGPGELLLLTAAGVWVAMIVFSVAALVPINNRLVADGTGFDAERLADRPYTVGYASSVARCASFCSDGLPGVWDSGLNRNQAYTRNGMERYSLGDEVKILSARTGVPMRILMGLVLMVVAVVSGLAQHPSVPLWAGGAPGSEGRRRLRSSR